MQLLSKSDISGSKFSEYHLILEGLVRGYYGDCESAIQPDACSAEQVLIVLPKISSCLTVASPSEINSDGRPWSYSAIYCKNCILIAHKNVH